MTCRPVPSTARARRLTSRPRPGAVMSTIESMPAAFMAGSFWRAAAGGGASSKAIQPGHASSRPGVGDRTSAGLSLQLRRGDDDVLVLQRAAELGRVDLAPDDRDPGHPALLSWV